uniref:UTRA domain-containing protein n=1 Tax=uncultured Pelagibacterium sp. TaxID=1159875 RepID=UPI0030D7A33A
PDVDTVVNTESSILDSQEVKQMVVRTLGPAAILGDPHLVADSLYAALDSVGVLPQRALQRMQAGPADALDRAHLLLEDHASLLIVERRCFFGDRVVEFTQTRYRGDVYDFVLELHR